MGTKCKLRKVINVGGSLGLTIPKEFADKNGIKVGDKVGLTYNSIVIIAIPQKPEENKE